jgi:hypothetical protein
MTSISANRPVVRNHDLNTFAGGAAKLADFMKTAIPTGVGAPKGLVGADGKPMSNDTVAFQMKSSDGKKNIDLAWDKASDKMFMLQGGKMVEVPSDVRAAAVDRLSEAGLAGRKSTSMYSQMRDDMVKTKESSVSTQKPPVLPNSNGNTEAIYDVGNLGTVNVEAEPALVEAEPAQVQTEIQQRPTIPLLQKPSTSTPQPTAQTEQKPTVTTQPTSTQQQQPTVTQQKPTVTTQPTSTQPTSTQQKPVTTSTQPTSTQPTKPALAPLPAAFANKVGAASERDMLAAIEQAPDAKTATAWVQELAGAKGKAIDGKFGPNTAKLLAGEDNVMKALREMQLKEPRAAERLSGGDKERIKSELTAARDNTRDSFDPSTGNNPPYENAVKKMQERLVRAGEVIPVDGKLGGDTYKAMTRVYGKAVADELSRHLQMLRTEEGA